MASSPFLSLPREIRDQVYGWVFTFRCDSIGPTNRGKMIIEESDEATKPLVRGFVFCGGGSNPLSQFKCSYFPRARKLLGLTLVNRQISAEAVASFYGTLVFSENPSSKSSLSYFIKGIGATRRYFIKTIELTNRFMVRDYDFSLDFGIFDLLCTLSNLQKLIIEPSIHDLGQLWEILMSGGVHKLTGRFQIVVRNSIIRSANHRLGEFFKFLRRKTYVWTCANGQKEWKQGDTQCEVFYVGGPGEDWWCSPSQAR